MGKSEGRVRRFRPPLWFGWLSWLLVVLLLAASAAYVAGPLARERGWSVDGGQPSIDPQIIAEIHSAPSGNGAISEASEPGYQSADADHIAAVLDATQPTLSGSYGVAVADLTQDGLSYESSAHTALTPASTLKIMTAIASLDALGAEHTFITSVVSTAQDQIVLVGGGDPLLASTDDSYSAASTIDLPTTADLAAKTAAALQARGVTQVSVGYDDSLFAGDVWHPDWAEGDREFVAPIGALSLDEGAGVAGTDSGSATVAAKFCEQLAAAGIEITGEATAASADAGEELAKVESVPLGLLVQEMLTHSDNFIAEMLLRQLAIADGHEASFTGGTEALTDRLTELGLWDDGQYLADGSGLSMNDKITPAALVEALQLAYQRPELSAVLAGLPVASSTGTTASRFADDQSAAARGVVRAKTGTLDSVSSLAGYTMTTDGALIVFALMGNGLPTDQDVRTWFDQAAAALADCECAAGS